MHRLVQAVTRTPDPGDPHRDPQAIDDARDQATRQLADALPGWQDPAGWPGWRMLLPHIDALASHAPPDTDTQDTAYLLNQAGLFLDGQGQPGRAAGYLQRALAGCVRVLGADHPDTLASRNNLAGAYEAAGDLGRAIPLYEQTLADRQRVLGADHPDTLISRNNLAYAYEAAGDLGRAIPLLRADPGRPAAGAGRRPPRHPGLAEQPRPRLSGGGGPGPGHPAARADPGRLRAGAGRRPPRHPGLAEQPRLCLPGRRGTWAGPSRCTSRPWPTGSGCWAPTTPTPWPRGTTSPLPTRSAGDLGRAIPLLEQALADSVRVLGADHPHTLTSRNNLAVAYRAAGDLGRAIPLLRAGPGRLRAGAGRRPPRHPGLAEQPRRRLPRRRGTWAGPSRCTSRPWPTACGCWAPTTPRPRPCAPTSPRRASTPSSAPAGVRAAPGGGRHAGGPEARSQRSGLILAGACPACCKSNDFQTPARTGHDRDFRQARLSGKGVEKSACPSPASRFPYGRTPGCLPRDRDPGALTRPCRRNPPDQTSPG